MRPFFAALALFVALLLGNAPAAALHPHDVGAVTVYVQVMDSCKQGLPGATMALVDSTNTVLDTEVSAGIKRVTVMSGTCPLPRGNCTTVTAGCLTFTVLIPASGTVTYTIREQPTYIAAEGFYENPTAAPAYTGFVPCTGGSACHAQLATFTVDSAGAVQGQTVNTYPDNGLVTWPSTSTYAAGTVGDPVVFHNFQLGMGICSSTASSDSNYLTGSPSSHCRNATPGTTWIP